MGIRKVSDSEILNRCISDVVQRIKEIGGVNIVFIAIYGSAVKGKFTDLSDIDVSVFYDGDKAERFDFRMKVLGRVNERFDLQIFQELPLYIQNDIILAENVVYFRDYEVTFDIFMKIIKNFEYFRPHLELYYSHIGVYG